MNTYKRHRFSPEIISYAVWLYYRFFKRLMRNHGGGLISNGGYFAI
jgi:hypothetical protein